jgi:hypothetical protein
MTLVDSNVLIDLAQDDPRWADWSEEQLLKAQKRGPLFINPIGYAELVPAMESKDALDDSQTMQNHGQRFFSSHGTPGRRGVFALPETQGNKNRRTRRLFHRCPGSNRRMATAHTRYGSIQNLFSQNKIDLPLIGSSGEDI